MKKHTYEEIKNFIESNSECTLISTEYVEAHSPLTIRCKCGNEFVTTWSKFNNQNKRQCNDCGNRNAHKAHLVSGDEIRKRLAAKGCELLTSYLGGKKPSRIKCACGHEKVMRIDNALYDNFSGLCDKCAYPLYRGNNRFTTEDIRELCALRGATLLSEYVSAKEPIRLRCSCGEEFVTSWATIKAADKTRCNRCTQRMSVPEKKIENWLKVHNIAYENEKSFPNCGGLKRLYRFDFYLPKFNICIEYDGQQHFKTVDFSGRGTQKELVGRLLDALDHDAVKTQYCKDNGIRLIRISYKDSIEEVLDSTLIPR